MLRSVEWWLPTLRDNISVPSSRVKRSKKTVNTTKPTVCSNYCAQISLVNALTKVRQIALRTGSDEKIKRLFYVTVQSLMLGRWGPKRVGVCVYSWFAKPLKMGPIGFPETSVTEYETTLRSIPEEFFLDHLTSEDRTDRLFRNVRKWLPIYDA